MQKETKVLLVVVVCSVLVTLPVLPVLAEDDGKTVQEKRYITAQGIAGTCLVQEDLSIGNACFHLQENSTHVAIEIDDDYFDVVYGNYRFFDGPWDSAQPPAFIDEGEFCTTAELEIPEEARFLIVFVDGHVGTPLKCEDGVGQGASIGTIIVSETNEGNFSTLR